MPKFERNQPGLLAWLLLSTLAAGVASLAITKPTLFLTVVAALAVLVVLARLTTGSERTRLLALAAAREGQTICHFARDFDARAVDTWIVQAMYEQLQGQVKRIHPAFPVRADDRLKEDLCLDDDDLDLDVAKEVEARTGRSLEGSAGNPYFGKVTTVRELVLFFQSQPRSNSAN